MIKLLWEMLPSWAQKLLNGIVLAVAGVAIVSAACTISYGVGYTNAEVKDAGLQVAAANAQAKEAARQARADQKTADAGALTAAVNAAKAKTQIEARTQTLYREVPIYVDAQADAGAIIPVGFVRLHDAAAAGTGDVLGPDGGSGADDAPSAFKLSDVGRTVVHNYGQCNAYAAQITGLQATIRSFQQSQKGGE